MQDSMNDKRQKNQLQMALALTEGGGGKLRRLDEKGPNRWRRNPNPKDRLEQSNGWKRSASGRTARRLLDE